MEDIFNRSKPEGSVDGHLPASEEEPQELKLWGEEEEEEEEEQEFPADEIPSVSPEEEQPELPDSADAEEDAPICEEEPIVEEDIPQYADETPEADVQETYVEEPGYLAESDIQEINPEDFSHKKTVKHKSVLKKIRRFFRRLAKLPASTLLILGGGIAFILLVIILVVVLLSGRNKPTEQPQVSSPVTSVEATPEPAISDEEGEEDTQPEETIHPMDALVLPDGRTYLKLNDSYPIIADIQARLIELGYMETPVVDGKKGPTENFGPATRTAVRKFQWCNSIECDGTVGRSTYDLLMSDSAKSIQLDRSISDSLFKDDIEKLQSRLIELGYMTGTASGKFAESTTKAVRAFQEANGLNPDGIVGLKTLDVLYSASAKKAS